MYIHICVIFYSLFVQEFCFLPLLLLKGRWGERLEAPTAFRHFLEARTVADIEEGGPLPV